MNKAFLKSLFLFFFLLAPLFSFAQMFSVNEGSDQRSSQFSPYLRAGVQMIDFQYKGDPAELGGTSSLAFTGAAAQIAYESGGLNFILAMGNNLTQLENRRYFNLNLNFTNPFYFLENENFSAGVPVKLETKLTSVRSDIISEEFSQTNLSAGAGLIMRAGAPEKFGISAQLIPSIGFSTASGGFIGGNVFSLAGKARINFYELIFGKNISLGYDYIFDSYNIDGEEYDYDFAGHSLTIGISL